MVNGSINSSVLMLVAYLHVEIRAQCSDDQRVDWHTERRVEHADDASDIRRRGQMAVTCRGYRDKKQLIIC